MYFVVFVSCIYCIYENKTRTLYYQLKIKAQPEKPSRSRDLNCYNMNNNSLIVVNVETTTVCGLDSCTHGCSSHTIVHATDYRGNVYVGSVDNVALGESVEPDTFILIQEV